MGDLRFDGTPPAFRLFWVLGLHANRLFLYRLKNNERSECG